MEYTIKPSSYISGLCYSIFRLEPFDRCSYGCVYCYARWYRGPHGVPRVKRGWLRLWRRLARLASGLEPRPWFRLSTLSEPFQEVDRGLPAWQVVEALRIAARYWVPLVVNSRSASVVEPEVFSSLLSLADRGLVVVQLSLSPRGFDRLAEPGAPPTYARLDALELLASHGVPVVARVQPLLPSFEEEALRLTEEALERGALGVIAESIRETRPGLALLYRLAGVEPQVGWEPYQAGWEPGREPLYHPPAWWRARMHAMLRLAVARYGGFYAACKDGWLLEVSWPGWRPGVDCCGLAYASTASGGVRGEARLLLRPTLHEYAYYVYRLGGEGWGGFVEWCMGELAGLGYVCGEMLGRLPGWVRRPLRRHEARLRRLVERGVWPRLLGSRNKNLAGRVA